MGRIRVLVVDDHRIFAEALAAALAAEPDVEVGAAGSVAAAERALERAAIEGRAFDVVLIDADLGAEGAATHGGTGGTVPGPAVAQGAAQGPRRVVRPTGDGQPEAVRRRLPAHRPA
ncbi:DNA-binding response regulator, partial [Kitasatospora sp. NPDC004240]